MNDFIVFFLSSWDYLVDFFQRRVDKFPYIWLEYLHLARQLIRIFLNFSNHLG